MRVAARETHQGDDTFALSESRWRPNLDADGAHHQGEAALEHGLVLGRESGDEVGAERDPRRAVIRTYARMERTFAAYGVARESSEAPLEYLTRVLDLLSVSTAPSTPLHCGQVSMRPADAE